MSNQKPLSSLFNLTHTLKRKMHDHVDKMELGIAPMHARVLKIIKNTDPCTAIDIAQKLSRDKAQVTRLLNTLIEHELITKQPNPEDKRSQRLRATVKGEEITQQISGIDGEIFKQITEGISSEELQEFTRIADKMTKNLQG